MAARALTPTTALILSAILNLLAPCCEPFMAATIDSGIVIPVVVTLETVLVGPIAAITWNLLTWSFGTPSSSSHCLVGGITGTVLGGYGHRGVQWKEIVAKVLIATIVSPSLGVIFGLLLNVATIGLLRRSQPGKVARPFRGFQQFLAGGMAPL